MFLHIMPEEKFTKDFVEYINTCFDPKQHIFAIFLTGVVGGVIPDNYENVFVIDKTNRSKLIKLMYSADGILLHYFHSENTLKLFLPRLWLLKKTNWVAWGGDIYDYERYIQTIKGKVFIFAKKIITKRIRYVTTLVSEDYEKAKYYYKTRGEYLEGAYRIPQNIEKTKQIKQNKPKQYDVINIQIGNNAMSNNNHIEMMKLLEPFVNENIRIFVPLSYGDDKNAEEVIEYGKRKFKDKFIPVTEFMPSDKYREFLNSIHIGIFDNDRQQGLGNINLLLYFGCKLYLRENTTMWEQLVNKYKYRIHSTAELYNIEFNELIRFDKNDFLINERIYLEQRSYETINRIWENVFLRMHNRKG